MVWVNNALHMLSTFGTKLLIIRVEICWPHLSSSYLWGNLLQRLQLTDDDELYFDERVILQMMMSSSRTAAHFSARRNRVIPKLDSIATTEH